MKNIGLKKIRDSVFDKYGGKCSYCGISLKKSFQVDHIVPLRRGCQPHESGYNNRGADDIDNYNPSCASCNSSKSTFSLEEWRSEINKKYDRLLRDSATFRLLIRFKIVKRVSKGVVFYFEKV